MTDTNEQAMIDEIIAGHDELAIYTNLSRRLERSQSSLTENAQLGNPLDTFERRGLAWVMALARVELGAMFAGFSNVFSPFEIVQPSQYEMAAYRELLMDGLRTHFWSLAGDPNLPGVAAKSGIEPGTETLAYVRRTRIALAFHDAATRSGIEQFAPTQLAELNKWQRELKRLQRGLNMSIQRLLAQVNLSESIKSSTTSSEFIEYLQECRKRCKNMSQGKKYKVREAVQSPSQ